MNRIRMLSQFALSLGASTLFAGCVFSAQARVPTVQATVNTPTVATTTETSVAVPAGVTMIQAQCQQGTQEACNGLDDNCNGVIDEGCGYQGGNVQITVAWQSSSDIDLHVTDPNNEEVFYGHRNSASGAVLDRDANAACNQSPPTVENVYWGTQPMPGQYRIRVVAYDMCGSPSTPATVSISVGGRILGTYSMNFSQRGQQFDIPFNVP
jgi:tRNA (guanosine-2'-O-)-methyltransferase